MKAAKTFIFFVLLFALLTPIFAAEEHVPEMSPGVTIISHDKTVFSIDPVYQPEAYSVDAQLKIYGGKSKVRTARPLFEIGRRLYLDGPMPQTTPLFGSKNRDAFWFMGFGDWRTAVGFNNKDNKGKRRGTLAAQINLDFDARLTATERIHAKMTPIDEGGRFTRYDFDLDPRVDGKTTDSEFVKDGSLDNIFFEGDFGPIFAGISGHDNAIDMPFSAGLVPLFTQNGIWVDDAMTGFAVTPVSAKNSSKLDISNFDITFFAAFDRITTPAFKNAALKIDSENHTKAYGFFGFADANRGYWEYGYAYVDSDFDGGSYHNFTVAHTRRIRHHLSNSIRMIANVGQQGLLLNAETGLRQKTANGVLLLVENSLITSKPSTLIPYFNFFAGWNNPQSLARAANAGGVLKNTGVNFEGDALTGLPNLTATGQNSYGGAVGLEYLFNLDQQIVVEGAASIAHGSGLDRPPFGNEYGIDVRWQKPFFGAWIVRADAMKGWRQKSNVDPFGVRLELRRKF
jgi:hypothetical protein